MKKLSIALVLAALALTPVLAQVKIDKSVSTAPDSEVGIENPFGSVTVIGWDLDEVKVTGTMAAGAEGIEVDSEGPDEDGDSYVWVSVEVPDSWFYDDDSGEFETNLTVHVPRGSPVGVETINGNVDVSDISGAGVYVEAVNGEVKISGAPSEVEVEAMTGDVEIDAVMAEISVEAVAGNVTVTGASGSVEIEAVAGNIQVEGNSMQEVSIESVNGNVELRGSTAARGSIEIETVAGNVDLMLDSGVKARFELATFSGGIENSLGPKPRKGDPHMPGKTLNFSTGGDDFEITVETFSGTIRLGAN